MTMRAAVYARVSTEDQKEAGSIATQKEFAERYCQLHGIDVYGLYLDDGVSGTVPVARRPQGGRLLADARAGKFETVLVYRIDRLARSTLELLQCVETLEANGVAVRSMSEPFETASSMGKFVLTMLGSIAQLEKDTIKERCRLGSLRVAREGKWTGGKAPLGYVIEDKHLVVEPEQAKLVKEIFRLYTQDRLSTLAIAAYLNARNVPLAAITNGVSRPMKGKWTAAMVSRILKNQTYAGRHAYLKKRRVTRSGMRLSEERVPPEQHIVSEVPPIIEGSVFAEAQRLLVYNTSMAKRNAKRDYLLRGLIKCGRCGRAFVGGGGSRGYALYYKCASNTHRPNCGAPYVRVAELEETVWADIVDFVHNPGDVLDQLAATMRSETSSQVGAEAEQEEVERALDGKKLERQRIVGALRRGLITEEEAAQEFDQLKSEVEVLGARRNALFNEHAKAEALQTRLLTADVILHSLRNAIDQADYPTKRAVVEALVDSIEVGEANDEKGRRRPHINIVYCFDPAPGADIDNSSQDPTPDAELWRKYTRGGATTTAPAASGQQCSALRWRCLSLMAA